MCSMFWLVSGGFPRILYENVCLLWCKGLETGTRKKQMERRPHEWSVEMVEQRNGKVNRKIGS